MTCKQCIINTVNYKSNKSTSTIFKLQKNFKEPKQQCGYSIIGDQGLTLELDPVHLNGMAVLSTSIISTWIKIREIPATQNNCGL